MEWGRFNRFIPYQENFIRIYMSSEINVDYQLEAKSEKYIIHSKSHYGTHTPRWSSKGYMNRNKTEYINISIHIFS